MPSRTEYHCTSHFVEDPALLYPEGCEPLLGLAEKVSSTDGISPGSTLIVLVIGDETTANEPWQLWTYSIPTTRKVLEGGPPLRGSERRSCTISGTSAGPFVEHCLSYLS
jgi:hypothetical protein